MKKTVTTLGLVLFIVMGVHAGGEGEASKVSFPEKPITIIVNYGPGGATDLAARLIAEKAEATLGQPITVVNKAGGRGTVGLTELMNAPNDGYTLGTAPLGALVITPLTLDVAFTLDSYDFIAGFGQYMYGIATRKESPYKSMEDLIEAARENPGRITFSSTGFPMNLAIAKLEKQENVKFSNVPFPSGAEAATAMMGGHVDITVCNPSDVISFLETGEARLLASASPTRWREWPQVSTLAEQGYDATIEAYNTIAAPAGIPKDVKDILDSAFQKAAADPELQEQIVLLGMEPISLSGEEYREVCERSRKEIGEAMKAMGIEVKD